MDESIFTGCCSCCWKRSVKFSLAICCDRAEPITCSECGEPCRNTGCPHIKSHRLDEPCSCGDPADCNDCRS